MTKLELVVSPFHEEHFDTEDEAYAFIVGLNVQYSRFARNGHYAHTVSFLGDH
jgi:hypothetical protein